MQIQSFSPTSAPAFRPAAAPPPEANPNPPQDGFDSPGSDDPGLMPSRLNCAEAGAVYGGLAGAGVAVALGCMTFGVGLMAGIATVPLGIALGTGLGAVADLVRGQE